MPKLPETFRSIQELHEGRCIGSLINVVGLVKDYRLPRGTIKDHKSMIVLYDLSTESEAGIELNIFCPEEDHPQVSAGDVIVLKKVRVQNRYGVSLITHRSTVIYVFSASKIPQPPASAKVALKPPSKRWSGQNERLTDSEFEYVSHIYHTIEKSSVPDEGEFQAKAQASLNVKDKFSLLSDARDGKFVDIFVQMVRELHDQGEMLTIYVSDFTENGSFFDYTCESVNDLDDGAKTEWRGPYGKQAMQITVWEPHATVVREEASVGQWMYLRNVQIKYGNDGTYLEGKLRGDRSAPGKINLMVIDIEANADGAIDPRFKEAIRRCRDYYKKKKTDNKELKQARAAGIKRKAAVESVEPQIKATKARRAAKRQEKQKNWAATVAAQAREAASLELNDKIKCENPAEPPSTVAAMLAPQYYHAVIGGKNVRLTCPFTNAKYLVNVRVVDFHPAKLENFAASRVTTIFEVLSDDSDDDSDDPDEEPPAGSRRVWEWRFSLQLEDATPGAQRSSKEPPPRIWVTVDNAEAQYLTGLDASDLRPANGGGGGGAGSDGDDDNADDAASSISGVSKLEQLRERMAVLWGDLADRKARELARGEEKKAAKTAAARMRLPGDKPPLDSSDAEGDGDRTLVTPSSSTCQPFACCVKQYGVAVAERNPAKADAGDGKRWKRMFALCSTKICV